MTALSVMQRLEATSSRGDKEQIIFGAFLEGETEFFVGARLALDPFVTFGVRKVAEIIEDDGEAGDFSFTEFVSMAHDLWRRKLSATEARAVINAAAQRCHVATWNVFYRRILLKDLKIGVQAKTMNRVLDKLVAAYPEAKEHFVPVFGCQLHDCKPVHQLRGRKRIEAKLGGARLITILDTQSQAVNLFTDRGKNWDNSPDLQAALHSLLAKLPGPMVLDGELVDGRYGVFDILPLADFRAGVCTTPQHERHALLAAMQECGLWQTTQGHAYVVPQIEVDFDTSDGQAAFAEFKRQAMANGCRALMVKDPDASYRAKRSSAWIEVDCA